ncbi:MAG: cysteine desulfurase family protein [Clostridiales bacterium]|nr:cysteine desulfurase family protein [Clostridiales bacterium]
MEAYFDNSATTPVYPEVRDLVVKLMEEDYGNPSSLHLKGVKAAGYIKDARERLARLMKVQPKEIVFTSGGTESNNMALIGGALANRRAGNKIITTSVEHASVGSTVDFLKDMGFEVVRIGVDSRGLIDEQQLIDAVDDDTIIVSVMYVNNEIGAVMPIQDLVKRVKEKNPSVLIHVDAIQAFGKYTIYPGRMGIDMMSISSHKFHGPKGVGALYIRDRVKVKPIIYGGGQQSGMRSGTENVPGIAGMVLAAEMTYNDLDAKVEHMRQLKEHLIGELTQIEDVYSNSGDAPHIASITFKGVRSEVMLHALEERGVYVSSGSACSSNKHSVSSTLKSIGLPQEKLESTLRFSFSPENTMDQVDYAVDCCKELLPVLRRYRRKK